MTRNRSHKHVTKSINDLIPSKEPLTALEDLQEVLVEDPNNIEVFCTQVPGNN